MTDAGDQRFESGADKYAAYLDTAEGRLRLDLAFANLQRLLPRTKPLSALDLGCGTGAIAVRLAQQGHHVTLLDSSQSMLDLAKCSAQKAGVAEKIALKLGDARQLEFLFKSRSFDLVLCHNILEYVDEPIGVLQSAASALRDSHSILSIVVRTQAGEVLKAAIQQGDVAASARNLTAEWGHESLYGGKVRLFTPNSLQSMLAAASLTATAEHGIRVLSDYLPTRISREDEYENILDLERRLGARPEFASIARYMHCVARHAVQDTQDDR